MSKTKKQLQAEQLGMPVGTARSRLQRNLVWKLLVRQGENRCFQCRDWISHPSDLAITHIEPWFDADPSLFWEFDNIAFMHPDCASAHGNAARRQGDNMNLVEVQILDGRGKRLPGKLHEGKVYVAGEHGQQYQIRVNNHSANRIEVVLTVDGRDVITGEEGTRESRGYVIPAYESTVVKGWRTSDESVAAFEFGADKEKAYATQLGDGSNLGLIGVAVFKEYVKPWTSGWNSGGFIPRGSGGKTFGSSAASFNASDTFESKGSVLRTCTMDSYEVPARSLDVRDDVQLGTKFGETLESEVGKTTFVRAQAIPDQELVFEYDTLSNLEKRGISMRKSTPSAFPADNRYCKPPKG